MSTSDALLHLKQNRSRVQIRFLLWIGFGGMLLLMAVLGISAISFLYQIELRQEHIREDYVERDRLLERLRSSTYLSGTHFRDFMLDSDESRARANRQRYQETREEIRSELSEYRKMLRPDEQAPFELLSQELGSYFATLDPALDWSAQTRLARGFAFVREEVLPRRMTVIGLTDQIQRIGERDLEAGSKAVSELFASFRTKLAWLLITTLLLATLLTGVTLARLLQLEHESAARFAMTVKAQGELKRLSSELVSAQESERRRIARELHDEVGQVLSAIVFGLGNLRSALKQPDLDEARRQVDAVEEMVTQNVKVVRNMSLLLRPTMLDDLGLMPALNWLARETSRLTGILVDVSAEPLTCNLPDDHRTCVYRVVQEGVRNAVRHSGAEHVRIYVQQRAANLYVSVQDDGKGFRPKEGKGLGLLGMEERVANLGGSLQIDSELGRGTLVSFHLPVPPEEADVERLAGASGNVGRNADAAGTTARATG
jgi:signal transduction histidine kinase